MPRRRALVSTLATALAVVTAVATLTVSASTASAGAATDRTGDRTGVRATAVVAEPGPVLKTVHRTMYRAAGRVTAPPRLRARAWAVADLKTGRILAVHHHRRYLPQASTIKLLTAVTASRTVPVLPRHRVTWGEAHPQYCTCAGLKVGARYTRKALMAGMLLPSGNDAALALAGAAGRGHAWFIRAMNAKARALGATDTHVVTPNGLTAPGAHSSARDLLIFLRAAQANRVVEPILELPVFRLGPRGGKTHRVYRGTDYVNEYARINPGTQGKSGYTTPAKNTLVVATPIDGHRIGVATLGAPGGYSTSGARALTLWATHNFGRLRQVGHLPKAPAPAITATNY
ncbi:MAG: D-alanyl-D-alanine carboxypeptidase family protein [Nocardioidaceae bacterium]